MTIRRQERHTSASQSLGNTESSSVTKVDLSSVSTFFSNLIICANRNPHFREIGRISESLVHEEKIISRHLKREYENMNVKAPTQQSKCRKLQERYQTRMSD